MGVYLCSVLKRAKMCLLDMNPFSTSRSFRLSTGNMYFFSFSCKGNEGQVTPCSASVEHQQQGPTSSEAFSDPDPLFPWVCERRGNLETRVCPSQLLLLCGPTTLSHKLLQDQAPAQQCPTSPGCAQHCGPTLLSKGVNPGSGKARYVIEKLVWYRS